jgi:hypothetical protein
VLVETRPDGTQVGEIKIWKLIGIDRPVINSICMMKKLTMKFWIVFGVTCAIGLMLSKIDTSKNWNDTGITVGLLLFCSFLLGAAVPRFAWLWAIILSAFIFLFNVIQSGNYQSVGALLFAFIGAYCGVFFNKVIFNARSH